MLHGREKQRTSERKKEREPDYKGTKDSKCPTHPTLFLLTTGKLPDGEQEKGSDGEKESKEQRFKVFH